MAVLSMKQLLEVGVHLPNTSLEPKMKIYH